jgi:nodulation protein E
MSRPLARVAITGLGVISPSGHDVESFWKNVTGGVSGIGPIENIDSTYLTAKNAAEVRGFDPALHLDAKKIPLMDRFAQMAVAASRQAVRDAGVSFEGELGLRAACITGSGVGGHGTLEDAYTKLVGKPTGRVHPFTIPRLMTNAATSHVAMDHGITGPAFTIASACASATHAIGVAFQMIRSGMIDRAVTGGAEACVTFGTLKGWEAMRVMSQDTCRPFSAGRQGLILGEGAAMLVLENLEDAKARGAHIYAELLGFGMTSDAKDLTSPDADGMTRAMMGCLADAALFPDQVDYINAHGTGTTANDATETEAIKRAFGPHAYKLAISASKSIFGHALGAAGALEAVVTALALQRGLIPPTANYQAADPACDLDYTPNMARAAPIKIALSNSFAFGGLNAVLAFRRSDDA